jgi:hypothetical protein
MRRTLFIMMMPCIVLTMAGFAQGVKLEYKFGKEKTYRYRDVLDAKSSQEMMGQEIKSEMHGSNVVRVVGESVNSDGSMVLIASTDSAVMTIKAPGVDTTQIPWSIIGKRFRMLVAKNGKVSNFLSVDAQENDDGQTVQNQLGHYPLLSDTAVSEGSTWNAESVDTITQKQFGGILVTDTKELYTVVGKEMNNGYNCFKIISSGKFTITGKGSMMGMDLHFDGSGTSDATIFFDPVQGVVVASEAIVDMQMTVATTGQSPTVIPTSESMKISRTLLR